MPSFKRASGGAIRARLDARETALLRELLGELRTLLGAEIRADPVVQRLFPDAHESAEEANAFRELIGDDLAAAKRAAVAKVETAVGSEGRVSTLLSEDDAAAWLTVLTDIRLAIGTRLEVTEEVMEEELEPDDPRAASLDVLHWLGWMQELMLRALTPLPER
ncbi:MAG: DUF2017 family protein [Actinobacteria bacterium]|nr:DUF2017 family protein [Actinomycetota bacterium]